MRREGVRNESVRERKEFRDVKRINNNMRHISSNNIKKRFFLNIVFFLFFPRPVKEDGVSGVPGGGLHPTLRAGQVLPWLLRLPDRVHSVLGHAGHSSGLPVSRLGTSLT